MTDVRQEIRMKGEMPFVEEISRDFSLRLGVGIDAVHVSNAVIDGVDFRQERKLYLTHTTLEDIDGRIRQQREAYPELIYQHHRWGIRFDFCVERTGMLAVFSTAVLRSGKIRASKSNMALGVVSHQVERSCVLMHKAHGW